MGALLVWTSLHTFFKTLVTETSRETRLWGCIGGKQPQPPVRLVKQSSSSHTHDKWLENPMGRGFFPQDRILDAGENLGALSICGNLEAGARSRGRVDTWTQPASLLLLRWCHPPSQPLPVDSAHHKLWTLPTGVPKLFTSRPFPLVWWLMVREEEEVGHIHALPSLFGGVWTG